MLVHRLLDAFFRTLDAVDAVRDRVDRVLGREPRPDPWAVEWPPPAPNGEVKNGEVPRNGEAHAVAEEAPARAGQAERQKEEKAEKAGEKRAKPEPRREKVANGELKGADVAEAAVAIRAEAKPAKKAAQKAAKTAKTAAPKTAAPKTKAAAKKAPAARGRKGSVDRQGKDFDSPRARAVHEHVKDKSLGIVSEEAEHAGKKVLARVLWALWAAEEAGSEKGLTTADASALLHLSAGMEVFATNIGRACRDHSDLIVETEPDGRSKRYKLTAAGRAAARSVPTVPQR